MISNQIKVLVNDINNSKQNALGNLKAHIQKTIANFYCVNCNRITDPATYKNQLDADEYHISGLCEKCQPYFFGEKQ